MSEIVPNVQKIAVLQAKAVGDFIVTLPALRAIKERYPRAELVYLGKPWHQAFLTGRPSPIDRVIVIPPSDGVRNEPEKKGDRNAPPTKENKKELDRFFQQMKDESFDIAIHLQGDGKKTNPFINKFGATLTVGMKNPGAEGIDRWIPYVHYQSEVLRNLEIASLIGATTTCIEPQLPVTEKDTQEAESFLNELNNNPFIVLHPGADDIRRVAPTNTFAAIGDALATKNFHIVITGSPKEKELVLHVMDGIKTSAKHACTTLSLGGLAALLSKSSLVVANDTGPLHLARAVGVATVGMYWFANVLNWGPLTRKKHRVAISWQLTCPNCGIMPTNPWPFEPETDTCKHEVSFVKDISPEDVVKQAEELLQIRSVG